MGILNFDQIIVIIKVFGIIKKGESLDVFWEGKKDKSFGVLGIGAFLKGKEGGLKNQL